MPGGSTNNPQQKKTIQTVLSAKRDKDKPPAKRTHSDISTDSNTSLDISGLINFQKDLDEIKFSLRDVTTKSDLNEVTKDLVKTVDLENMVTGIVKKLFSKFESTLEKKMNDKITKIQTEMQEKVDALSIENEHLTRKVKQLEENENQIKRELKETTKIAKVANSSSNYNEQYSRKNNIKVYNFPWHEKQDLRKDFIEMAKSELNVTLEERDIVAIHRLPADPVRKPLIVKCFNTDVKRRLMRERKQLKNNVKFVDDVTTRNMALINRMENSGLFDQVWYFNCGIYGRTEDDLQMKFGIYDDLNQRLREGK